MVLLGTYCYFENVCSKAAGFIHDIFMPDKCYLQCKVDEFLGVTSSTVESYVDTYKEDVPQDQTDETVFILALCGIITSKVMAYIACVRASCMCVCACVRACV